MVFLADWWQSLETAEQAFWILAVAASVLFVFLFGLSLLGLGADTGAEADVDHEAGHDVHTDKDFSAFSLRSLVAFLTFFGWTGVYLLSLGHGVWLAVMLSLLSGMTAMFVVAYMIFKFAQMEKSGTVNVYNTLNHTGEVYLSIPQQLAGKGKVHIIVDGSLHEFDAETRGRAIPTGSPVRVVEVLEDEVLLVEPVIPELQEKQHSG
jgi:membrane protein implicated in regulation of membrane protease activity